MASRVLRCVVPLLACLGIAVLLVVVGALLLSLWPGVENGIVEEVRQTALKFIYTN